MGDLRNILLIALWLGAKGVLFGSSLVITRQPIALPQQQQQQGLPGMGGGLPGMGGMQMNQPVPRPVQQQATLPTPGQQQQQTPPPLAPPVMRWHNFMPNTTSFDADITFGYSLSQIFNLGRLNGAAGPPDPVVVISQTSNVSITWGSSGATPPVSTGLPNEIIPMTVTLKPITRNPSPQEWKIIIGMGAQVQSIKGRIFVFDPGETPPVRTGNRGFAQTQGGTALIVRGYPRLTTLMMRFNSQSGKMRAVKRGVYTARGYYSTLGHSSSEIASLNARQILRGYR